MGRTLEAGVVNFGRGLAGVPVASGERRFLEKEIGFARTGCHATGQKLQVTPKQVQATARSEERITNAKLRDRAQHNAGSVNDEPGKYQVKRGDTLTDLSRRYGLPVEQLAELNHLEDPNFIEAGEQILVPGQFVEELSQYVPTHPGGGQQWEVHIKKVRERRVVRKKVHKSSAPDALKREVSPPASSQQPIGPTADSLAFSSGLDLRDQGWGAPPASRVKTGANRLRTREYSASVNVTGQPLLFSRLPSRWASLGALLLIIAMWSFVLHIGADRIQGVYVSLWSQVVERKAAEKKRRADLEAAKKAESQRMRNWWRSVVDDDRKAAQLAPDTVNGSITSRLPSEPSIGKQAREIEQKRLEEEYNTFIRKIKVKDKDDGLIG